MFTSNERSDESNWSHTLSSSLARNSTNAACTSSSGGAGKLEVLGLDLGFGVERGGGSEEGAEPGGAPTAGGPGVAIGGRFCKVDNGVPSGVA